MIEFFRGWKRKIGCVTLVLALVGTGMWLRSRIRFDQFVVPCGNRVFINIVSMCGGIDFGLSTNVSNPWTLRWRSLELSPSEERSPWDDGHEIEWRWDWMGFHIGVGHLPSRRDFDLMVPYWFIVIPLTLTSACLLLSKNRKSTKTKISEPTENVVN